MAASEKTAQRHSKWKRQILALLRESPKSSRMDIKRATGLSMESTLSLVEELLSEGRIESVGTADCARAGRPATLLRICPSGAYFIGVRFSAGGIHAQMIDFTWHPVSEKHREFAAAPDTRQVIDGILETVDELIGAMGDRREKIMGIGIGAPGLIDLENGIVRRYVHIPDWKDVPLRGIVSGHTGCPVWVEHGVKCTARAVAQRETVRKSSDMLFVQIGRGVNLCALSEGRIINGAGYLSGEIGHVYVPGNPNLCQCGRVGCLETLVSEEAVQRQAAEAVQKDPDGTRILRSICPVGKTPSVPEICAAADLGDEYCRRLLKTTGETLADVLAVSMLLLNPDRLILCGAMCTSGLFCRAVRDRLKERCLAETFRSCSCEFLNEGYRLDTYGAALLPCQHLFAPGEDKDFLD